MSDMVPMYGFGGGGGTGATLTVAAPAACRVTVSKDGKSKTKISGADGVAVFKGLDTGEWKVTITDGVQTSAPKTVTITADYSTTMSFFSATIHVIYPAGSVCTASDGVTILTAPDTSGTWVLIVNQPGDWEFSLNSGLRGMVSITENGKTETMNQWHLYNNGDEYVEIVSFNPTSDFGHTNKEAIKTPDYIQFLNDTGAARSTAIYGIADLTHFSKFCVEITASGYELGNGGVWASPKNNPLSSNAAARASYSPCSTKTKFWVDISSINGPYACAIGSWADSQDIKIYRMWLE